MTRDVGRMMLPLSYKQTNYVYLKGGICCMYGCVRTYMLSITPTTISLRKEKKALTIFLLSPYLGIYPYEAALSVEQLRNSPSLPPIEAFYSRVSNSTATQEEYEHAHNVYKTFRCKNMLEYTGKLRR